MRFDVPIYFQRIRPGEYDKNTGDYGTDLIEEEKRYANVTDSGTEVMTLVYGKIRQGCKVVRLQMHCTKAFDYIRIGSKVYQADLSRKLRTKQIFIVSEVQ